MLILAFSRMGQLGELISLRWWQWIINTFVLVWERYRCHMQQDERDSSRYYSWPYYQRLFIVLYHIYHFISYFINNYYKAQATDDFMCVFNTVV